MRLIDLNLWGGKIYDPLVRFLDQNKDLTDIFCFQEVYDSPLSRILHENKTNLLRDLSERLTDFNYYYYPMFSGWDDKGKTNIPISLGQATFVKKNIGIQAEGFEWVYLKERELGAVLPSGRAIFPRNFLYTKLKSDGQEFLVLNLHGFWEQAPKYDTPQRFAQSQKILDFIKEQNLPTILAGDFNISLNTRSILMLEDNLDNLVRKYNLPTTRSSLYKSYYRVHDPFADYVFISRDVGVKNFKSLPDEVSDHLALLLDFELKG